MIFLTMDHSAKPPIVIRRYPVSLLSDVVSFVTVMPSELAETIRTLRRDHGVAYAELGYFLCESDPDAGASFGLGKALVEIAVLQIGDEDRSWK